MKLKGQQGVVSLYQVVWEENNMTDEVMNSGIPPRPHSSNSRQKRTAV